MTINIMPTCTVCGRRKKPIGRDSMDNGLCDHDCAGYLEEPLASEWWSLEELRAALAALDAGTEGP